MATGIERIATERQRQIDREGWTPEHDDEHVDCALIAAAVAYATASDCHADLSVAEGFWPWNLDWWKPSDDPIRNLEKAGALIAAEIDRLQRKAGAE